MLAWLCWLCSLTSQGTWRLPTLSHALSLQHGRSMRACGPGTRCATWGPGMQAVPLTGPRLISVSGAKSTGGDLDLADEGCGHAGSPERSIWRTFGATSKLASLHVRSFVARTAASSSGSTAGSEVSMELAISGHGSLPQVVRATCEHTARCPQPVLSGLWLIGSMPSLHAILWLPFLLMSVVCGLQCLP
jgi:hypothetical protein